MSIATAITAAQGKVADCYTAISNKGGTLPATQNLANMPTAIGSIPSDKIKYGVSIDNILGNTDSSGVYRPPSGSYAVDFTGVKNFTSFFRCKFYYEPVSSVSFPDLETLTGYLYYSFTNTNITSLSFPKLQTISGSMQDTFAYCYSLKTVDFPLLTTISSSYVFDNTFNNDSSLETVYFTSLSSVTSSYAFMGTFASCSKLSDVYFNALTTTSFGSNTNPFMNILQYTGTTTTHTLHFPSNLESTIQGLTGYPLFGGTNGYVVLSFDLPQTS
jgi:hypothetical protein